MDETRERLYLQLIAEGAAERAREEVSLREQLQQVLQQLASVTADRDELRGRIEAIEAQSAPAEEQPPAAV